MTNHEFKSLSFREQQILELICHFCDDNKDFESLLDVQSQVIVSSKVEPNFINSIIKKYAEKITWPELK